MVAAWRHPALRRALTVNTVFHAANLGAYTFLGVVLVQRFDLSVTALGLVGILVGAGSVAGSLLGGRLGDRDRAAGRHHLPLLPLWGLLLAAGIALSAVGPGIVLALLGVTLWFVASGGFVTDQQTLAGTAAPDLRATGRTWTFTLREGVKFQDGTAFDADAVVFNLDRYLDEVRPYHTDVLGAAAGEYAGGITQYTKLADDRVELVTAERNGHFPPGSRPCPHRQPHRRTRDRDRELLRTPRRHGPGELGERCPRVPRHAGSIRRCCDGRTR
ncbi:ABC transporter substrate-binding protein [Streptomyces sp. NPDC056716]|uniref:ABC transporter substrate-binding protein n=1 Tax=unclassified Streptomyces TaxID=2593676 RepID=UPI00367DA8B1